MKVVVGIPSGDLVHADFATSLARMYAFTASETKIKIIGTINAKSSIIEKGRHEMIIAALETEATHILMLDSDMTFPEDVLQQLASKGKEIIGCNYSTRRVPYKQLAIGLDDKYFPERIQTTEEVKYIPTGCLLIDLKIFKEIGKPYFKVEWDGVKFIGEDYYFCNKVRLLGHKIFCDFRTSLYVGHIGTLTARL